MKISSFKYFISLKADKLSLKSREDCLFERKSFCRKFYILLKTFETLRRKLLLRKEDLDISKESLCFKERRSKEKRV